ncbi:MAG: DsbA family protein [Candidatus Gracilibacteria bacterium]|jgi:protein-disulfide isomerase|nr:DsbA family protein [Candidatus Gracilibacteria bacterium]
MNDKKSKILIGAFLGLFTIVSIAMVIPPSPNNQNDVPSKNILEYNSSEPQVAFGEPKVVLVEYSDFQCPYCAIVDQTIISPVIEKKIEGSAFVFKHLPLKGIHPNAVISAVASEAALNQGKFFEYKDLLYKNQSDWSDLADPKPIFLEYAKSLSLDEAKFENDINSIALTQKIENAYSFGIENGLNSTPTLFLNGKQIRVKTPEELEELILSEISGK